LLDEERDLAQLLAWAIRSVTPEMPTSFYFGTEQDDRFVPVEVHGPGNAVDKLLVAVCDRSARGGGLGKQVEELAKRAGDIVAVIARSSPFPKSAAAAVSKQIANLIAPKGKGRRVEVQNADWRAMVAFREFHQMHQAKPGFASWQQSSRPLSSLPALRSILELDKLCEHPANRRSLTDPGMASSAKAPTTTQPAAAVSPTIPRQLAGTLLMGTVRGTAANAVTARPQELTSHAAFLGGSGSGKTTAALALIEQLLDRGIPSVLIDRKGDLARYADSCAWEEPGDDSARAEKRKRLRERVDVALFTPSAAKGRPLTLPIAPADLGQLPEADREQLCQYVAAALGGMMGYKPRGIEPRLAILGKAIEVLAASPGGHVTVRGLQEIIENQDEALLVAVGGFDGKHYRKLAEDLLALSLQRQRLLEGPGETMDLDMLLGRGPYGSPGKTQLAIINMQFLGGADAVDFWMAQFLVAVGRWAVRNPSPNGSLQAVFLFDEADQYLPATRQPATKGPMENLLRRARSAGIGLFLATQSPGDFDYKCRDQIRLWLLGRVKEQVAIGKLKPMLESARVDAAAKLPGQGAGQFYLVREREVTAVQTELSLLSTAQLPEDRILELARLTAERRAK
jgi:hypothetical protein